MASLASKGQISKEAAAKPARKDRAEEPFNARDQELLPPRPAAAASMALSTTTYPLVLLLPLLLLAAVASAEAAACGGGGNGNGNGTSSPTAYEMLQRYGFPRGILPEGVSGYELRPDDGGAFEVRFPRACEFLLARRWLVRYEARVSGAVASGRLTALQGISVKVLFLWLGVGEVDRAGDQLSFYLGPVATSFPLQDFAESPRCRGYDAAAAGVSAASW